MGARTTRQKVKGPSQKVALALSAQTHSSARPLDLPMPISRRSSVGPSPCGIDWSRNSRQKYPEGTGLRFEIETAHDIAAVKKLAAIKLQR
jgi:hypothetical protein